MMLNRTSSRLGIIWRRLVEIIFGGILPTPFMLFVSFYGLGYGGGEMSSDFVGGVTSIAIDALALISIVLLWHLLIFGPERIIRRPILRRMSVGILILILGFIFYDTFLKGYYMYHMGGFYS